jgi:hypothetical protein
MDHDSSNVGSDHSGRRDVINVTPTTPQGTNMMDVTPTSVQVIFK